MPETILVIVEQREGKLNRVSWETLAAGQSIAAETGWSLEAVVLGSDVGSIANEIAEKKVAKVYDLESPALSPYTPDAFSAGLKEFLASRLPKLVLMQHTYQVRDFVPKLATAMGRTVISDCVGYRKDGEKLLFTRQMFQGKFAADVSFSCDSPWFVTFQNGAFRADKVEAGKNAAPVERVNLEIPAGTIELAKQLAEALGGEIAASRPICDSGWLPMDRQIGSSGQTVAPKLYLALGISGAIQHIVGMKGARLVIAINKDHEAPIFEIADVAVVGNLFDIVPPLIEEVKKVKAGT